MDPPPFDETANVILLDAKSGSKITNLSLYSGHAEITRVLQFNVQHGANQLTLSGLPNLIVKDSIRVEGRGLGRATIHDVTLSATPPNQETANFNDSSEVSLQLRELERKRDSLDRAIYRSKEASSALKIFLNTIHVEHLDANGLEKVIRKYKEAENIEGDERTSLKEELLRVKTEIVRLQQARSKEVSTQSRLKMQVAISLFGEEPGPVQIVFVYSVTNAAWSVSYDIRVDMNTKESPFTLIYKALISQDTGEDWTGVPLTLETAHQTFDENIPYLSTLTLSKRRKDSWYGPPHRYSRSPVRRHSRRHHSRSRSRTPEPQVVTMAPAHVPITSKGDITATYVVPGHVSVPSDGEGHNVTVAKLKLEATMEWVAVPKINSNVYLKAKAKNTSEYTLLAGPAKIYVDGSYIATSQLPQVSPQETFDCALGLDPSIKIQTVPQTKKTNKSGMLNKTLTHEYTRRITIHNTKLLQVPRLRLIDRTPVSEDAEIQVKLVSPALTPVSSSNATTILPKKIVKVSELVTVQWAGLGDDDVDQDTLGEDGKIEWIVRLPAKEKVNLTLNWKVFHSDKITVYGLN
ncbi:hypothetical protein DL96DRAFT_1596007 [Flagelloscypha sp. PMI_526]|nr:hypothetical protein DL96DRAFT_1596007 [Flagelloscypha sp. PMI_526]